MRRVPNQRIRPSRNADKNFCPSTHHYRYYARTKYFEPNINTDSKKIVRFEGKIDCIRESLYYEFHDTLLIWKQNGILNFLRRRLLVDVPALFRIHPWFIDREFFQKILLLSPKSLFFFFRQHKYLTQLLLKYCFPSYF